jgi:predicted hydrocarbon binding protein
MASAGIGRVLVASLHQAISDLLPTRLEFYEGWLLAGGFKTGSMGLAPMSAVLSFLRREGDAYERVMARAGAYAGEWTVAELPSVERWVTLALPGPFRARAAFRLGRSLVRKVYPVTRATTQLRRGTATIELRQSLFCDVRREGRLPLCGFYAAAFAAILAQFLVPAHARIETCRGAGAPCCTLSVVVRGSGIENDTVVGGFVR